MRDMMKGVKNLKDIPAARKMEMCKSYNSMGDMKSQLAKCTSSELKAGLMNAKHLCGGKKHGSGSGAKKHGSGSGGKKHTGMRESERWRTTMSGPATCFDTLPPHLHCKRQWDNYCNRES